VLVDRADLVGQRPDGTAADRHVGVKQAGQADAFALGDQAELVAIALDALLAATSHQLQVGFLVSKVDLGLQIALSAPEDQVAGLAHHLDADDLHGFSTNPARDLGVWGELFQPQRHGWDWLRPNSCSGP